MQVAAALMLALVPACAALPPNRSAAAGPAATMCEFEEEPLFPGHYWDPTCEMGKEGCGADGKNVQCRFCGGGNYSLPCPASSCSFPGGDPFVPYYWEASCEAGMLGCWADGIHAQCRFCGRYPFTSVPCPDGLASPAPAAACAFAEEPATPHFWDPTCRTGMHGCHADGVHEQCRFCGAGAYTDIPCPASKVCSFAAEPAVPYYWDPECSMGKLGCMADGVHAQCRFCRTRPFEDIPCPVEVAPPTNSCTFPLRNEPVTPYYWDPSCKAGVLGCWADGLHAECRFCGAGVFQTIACPHAAALPGATVSPASPSHVQTPGAIVRDFLMASQRAHDARPAEPKDALEKETELSGSRPGSPHSGAWATLVGAAWLGGAARRA